MLRETSEGTSSYSTKVFSGRLDLISCQRHPLAHLCQTGAWVGDTLFHRVGLARTLNPTTTTSVCRIGAFACVTTAGAL